MRTGMSTPLPFPFEVFFVPVSSRWQFMVSGSLLVRTPPCVRTRALWKGERVESRSEPYASLRRHRIRGLLPSLPLRLASFSPHASLSCRAVAKIASWGEEAKEGMKGDGSRDRAKKRGMEEAGEEGEGCCSTGFLPSAASLLFIVVWCIREEGRAEQLPFSQ